MSWTTLYLILFFCGMAVSGAGTALILRFVGTRFGADKSDGFRKHHGRDTSRLGGVAVFLSFALGVGWLAAYDSTFLKEWLPVLTGSGLIFLLGLIDDIHPLGAKAKFLGQIVIAIATCAQGLILDQIANPMGGSAIPLPIEIGVALTVLWLVAIPNLINLIDGMDGLSSGIGIFICLTIGIISALAGSSQAGILAIIMAGALLGFLIFNFPPAKIFLGDGGAYFLGFFIASASLKTSETGSVAASLLVVVIALGIPILDTLFALARRGLRGVPLFRADAEHVHHQLLAIGFSKGSVLLLLYGVCAVLSLSGLALFWTPRLAVPIGGTILVVLAISAARLLGYVDSFRDLSGQLRRAMRNRQEVRYAMLLGETLTLEVSRFTDSVSFWKMFDESLQRVGLTRDPSNFENPVATTSVPMLFHDSKENEKNWEAIATAMEPAYSAAKGRFKD